MRKVAGTGYDAISKLLAHALIVVRPLITNNSLSQEI